MTFEPSARTARCLSSFRPTGAFLHRHSPPRRNLVVSHAASRLTWSHIMAGIIELLQRHSLPKGARVKIVRHQDKRCDLHALTKGQFEAGYQAFQAKPVFNCDFIVSCIGLPKSK